MKKIRFRVSVLYLFIIYNKDKKCNCEEDKQLTGNDKGGRGWGS